MGVKSVCVVSVVACMCSKQTANQYKQPSLPFPKSDFLKTVCLLLAAFYGPVVNPRLIWFGNCLGYEARLVALCSGFTSP